MTEQENKPGVLDDVINGIKQFMAAKTESGVPQAEQQLNNANEDLNNAYEQQSVHDDTVHQKTQHVSEASTELKEENSIASKQKRNAIIKTIDGIITIVPKIGVKILEAVIPHPKKALTVGLLALGVTQTNHLDTYIDDAANLLKETTSITMDTSSNNVTVQVGSFTKMENARNFAQQAESSTGGAFEVVKTTSSKGNFILAVIGETTCDSAQAFMELNNQPANCETLQSYAKNSMK